MVTLLLLALSLGCTSPRLAKLDPNLSATHSKVVLGQDYEASEAEAAASRSALDDVARGWFLRARVAELRGDSQEAERAWRWALRHDRDSAYLWSHRALSLERQRRWEEASEACEQAVLLDPTLAAPHLIAARVALQQEQEQRAVVHLSRALYELNSAQAASMLGRLYLRRGDRTAASEVLDTWRTLPASSLVNRLQRATLARDLSRPREAVDDLVWVAQQPGAPASAYSWLASAAAQSCRAGTALSWAQQADVSDEAQGAAVEQIARLAADPRLLKQRWPTSERTITQQAQLDEIWRRAGPPEQALGAAPESQRSPALTLSAALDAQDPEAALLIAQAAPHDLSEQQQQQIARLLTIMSPVSAEVWVLAARVGVQPRRSATRALALDPCNGAAHLLFISEQGCEAIAALERAWDASPSRFEVRERLIRAYDRCATPATERVPVWELP